jgi:hypothetical protein
MKGVHHGRRLSFHELGYIELVFLASAVGDTVVALYGGTALNMIRRVEDKCCFVGESYVFGLLHEDVMDDLDEDGVEESEFY